MTLTRRGGRNGGKPNNAGVVWCGAVTWFRFWGLDRNGYSARFGSTPRKSGLGGPKAGGFFSLEILPIRFRECSWLSIGLSCLLGISFSIGFSSLCIMAGCFVGEESLRAGSSSFFDVFVLKDGKKKRIYFS